MTEYKVDISVLANTLNFSHDETKKVFKQYQKKASKKPWEDKKTSAIFYCFLLTGMLFSAWYLLTIQTANVRLVISSSCTAALFLFFGVAVGWNAFQSLRQLSKSTQQILPCDRVFIDDPINKLVFKLGNNRLKLNQWISFWCIYAEFANVQEKRVDHLDELFEPLRDLRDRLQTAINKVDNLVWVRAEQSRLLLEPLSDFAVGLTDLSKEISELAVEIDARVATFAELDLDGVFSDLTQLAVLDEISPEMTGDLSASAKRRLVGAVQKSAQSQPS
jgi:hypothetical protein